MKRSTFLILDANVIIHLFKTGAWKLLVERCTLHVSRTIVEQEAHFYLDDTGARVDFDLREYETAGTIQVVEAALEQTGAFISQFDPLYAEKLDPGELESLTYLLGASDELQICSSDAIVFRVLGNLDRSERGVSLEEVLHGAGLGRKLPFQYTKSFRERYTAKGVEERLQGLGRR